MSRASEKEAWNRGFECGLTAVMSILETDEALSGTRHGGLKVAIQMLRRRPEALQPSAENAESPADPSRDQRG